MSRTYSTDILVIGAGQAGLSIGYYLKKAGANFLLLDAGERIGDSWRKRYDSLVLFTPRSYSGLPGMPFPGREGEYPTKDETADYLASYAKAFALPVQLDTRIELLVRRPWGYDAKTSRGDLTARQVVVATGPFQKPNLPSLSTLLDPGIRQIHSSAYKNPEQLPAGDVLIVGAGNSGAQIAVELAQSRKVTLAAGHSLAFLPLEFASKSVFWWFDKLGVLDASVRSPLGSWLRKRPDPIFGLELKKLIDSRQVRVKPRVTAADGAGLMFRDRSLYAPSQIVWATGFRPDYSWLQVEGALDPAGVPLHARGVAAVPGLYFLGLPWQERRASALLGGVGQDAQYVCSYLLSKRCSYESA